MTTNLEGLSYEASFKFRHEISRRTPNIASRFELNRVISQKIIGPDVCYRGVANEKSLGAIVLAPEGHNVYSSSLLKISRSEGAQFQKRTTL